MSFNAAKALKGSVVLLSGDESQLRRRALGELLEAAGVQKDDLDLEFVNADSSSPNDWFASVSTIPFLSERRILVVRGLLAREVADLRGVSLNSVPRSGLLILVADEEAVTSEDRQRKLAKIRGDWEKHVKDAGGFVEAFKASPEQVREMIKSECQRLGKSISEKAVGTLIEMTGGSLSRSLDELEKLALFAGNSDQIRESEILEIVVPSRDWNVFKLIDAIVAGSIPEALRQLRIIVGGQTKVEEAAIGRILPLMSRQLRLIWQGRLCVDAGCHPSRMSAEVLAMLPKKPNITEEQPYRQNSIMGLARKIDRPKLTRCLQILSATDARLKGALPSFSGLETMERMVLDMSQVVARV